MWLKSSHFQPFFMFNDISKKPYVTSQVTEDQNIEIQAFKSFIHLNSLWTSGVLDWKNASTLVFFKVTYEIYVILTTPLLHLWGTLSTSLCTLTKTEHCVEYHAFTILENCIYIQATKGRGIIDSTQPEPCHFGLKLGSGPESRIHLPFVDIFQIFECSKSLRFYTQQYILVCVYHEYNTLNIWNICLIS